MCETVDEKLFSWYRKQLIEVKLSEKIIISNKNELTMKSHKILYMEK